MEPMRELKVTQQSPQSHIVIHCHGCGTSWYIRPDDDEETAGCRLQDAVDHECREQVMAGR